jgi:hypothetical protein
MASGGIAKRPQTHGIDRQIKAGAGSLRSESNAVRSCLIPSMIHALGEFRFARSRAGRSEAPQAGPRAGPRAGAPPGSRGRTRRAGPAGSLRDSNQARSAPANPPLAGDDRPVDRITRVRSPCVMRTRPICWRLCNARPIGGQRRRAGASARVRPAAASLSEIGRILSSRSARRSLHAKACRARRLSWRPRSVRAAKAARFPDGPARRATLALSAGRSGRFARREIFHVRSLR